MIYIKKSNEFDDWFFELNNTEQLKVAARLKRIQDQEHFGDVKNIGEGLNELRWKNGWRIYFIVMSKDRIFLLIGGHKNEQKKDIKKAQLLIRKYSSK